LWRANKEKGIQEKKKNPTNRKTKLPLVSVYYFEDQRNPGKRNLPEFRRRAQGEKKAYQREAGGVAGKTPALTTIQNLKKNGVLGE